MDSTRALKIVRAINDRGFLCMEMVKPEDIDSLEGVSLSDMIEATRAVEAINKEADQKGGPHTIYIVPADRLIAAVYTLENYASDNSAIAMAPTTEWPYSRRAVAVVGLELKKIETSDDEAADE